MNAPPSPDLRSSRPQPAPASMFRALPCLLALLLLLPAPPSATGQTPEEGAPADGGRWASTTELTYLVTGGNSAASTLGLRKTLRRTDDAGELRFDVTTLRTDATRISRRAVGTSPDDFRVEEDRDTERSAERYGVRSRYDRNLNGRFFAFGGVGWERNTFAGFDHRTVFVTGAGNRWGGEEDWELKVGYGLTYTVQRDVTPDPERDDRFAGLQVTLDHAHRLREETTLEVAWIIDGNAREPSDVRGELVQAVTASLTDRLALKTTLDLKIDLEPPVEGLPLMAPNGTETGEQVRAPLRRIDHGLSVALVLTL